MALCSLLLLLSACTFVTPSDWDQRKDADSDGADGIGTGLLGLGGVGVVVAF